MVETVPCYVTCSSTQSTSTKRSLSFIKRRKSNLALDTLQVGILNSPESLAGDQMIKVFGS